MIKIKIKNFVLTGVCAAVCALMIPAAANAAGWNNSTQRIDEAGSAGHYVIWFTSRTYGSGGTHTYPTTNIANFDAAVQDDADNNSGSLTLGTGWKVLGSTGSVHAKDHLGGYSNFEVFNLAGTKIANNFNTSGAADGNFFGGGGLIDGTEITRVDGTTGLSLSPWTGTNQNGTATGGFDLLSGSNVMIGDNNQTIGNHLNSSTAFSPSANNQPLFGMKFIAAESAAVPEPSTYVMLGSMLLLATVTRKKKVTASRT